MTKPTKLLIGTLLLMPACEGITGVDKLKFDAGESTGGNLATGGRTTTGGGTAGGSTYHATGGTSSIGTSATLTVSISDMCDDGYQVAYRLFDTSNSLVWPSKSDTYQTDGYGIADYQVLHCKPESHICYAAQANSNWGLNMDGSGSCSDNCCTACVDKASVDWNLPCK